MLRLLVLAGAGCGDDLGVGIVLRRRVEEQTGIIHTTLEATGDGILVTDVNGKILKFNNKYAEIWGIRGGLFLSGTHQELLAHIGGKVLKDPASVLAETRSLYSNPWETQ